MVIFTFPGFLMAYSKSCKCRICDAAFGRDYVYEHIIIGAINVPVRINGEPHQYYQDLDWTQS